MFLHFWHLKPYGLIWFVLIKNRVFLLKTEKDRVDPGTTIQCVIQLCLCHNV